MIFKKRITEKSERFVLGLDIGGTNLRVALVDSEGRVHQRIKKESTTEDLLSYIVETLEDLEASFSAVGLGIAGIIDYDKRVVLKSPNLHPIEGLPIANEIEKRFKVPVVIENDANAAAVGEMWKGAGRQYRSYVLLTLGTGVGGGVINEGKLLRVAAELGHMTLDPNGPICACGNSGCLEVFSSAKAVVSDAIKSLEEGADSVMRRSYEGNYYRLTSKDIYKFALEGDSLAREVMRKAGKYLGIGIASLINIFSPEAVIIGGGLAGAWDIIVPEAKKEASRRAFQHLYERVQIRPAELGDDAGVLGAAYLALTI